MEIEWMRWKKLSRLDLSGWSHQNDETPLYLEHDVVDLWVRLYTLITNHSLKRS